MSYLANFYFQVSTTSLLHSVELKADRQTLGQRGWANIPDGLAGGFVLDRGGEGGVSLVLKQEGQRCLRRVWSETLRQIKATGFSSPAPPECDLVAKGEAVLSPSHLRLSFSRYLLGMVR